MAIGGGSATGLAKAVARETGLPVLAVPTTYAGSEMTSIWGLTDTNGKTTGRDPRVLPRTVVYDPELTTSLPADTTAASGMNALAHALEAGYAPDATPRLGELAQEALRALATGAAGRRRRRWRPRRPGPRRCTARGSPAGCLGSTTMGLHHKLAHVLGGTYRLPHAGVHSALLPQVAAFNAPAAPQAFAARRARPRRRRARRSWPGRSSTSPSGSAPRRRWPPSACEPTRSTTWPPPSPQPAWPTRARSTPPTCAASSADARDGRRPPTDAAPDRIPSPEEHDDRPHPRPGRPRGGARPGSATQHLRPTGDRPAVLGPRPAPHGADQQRRGADDPLLPGRARSSR